MRSGTRAVALCVVGAAALLALSHAGAGAKSKGFVTRSGTQLLLNGKPYLFTGLNIYNANSDGSCWYQLNSGPGLDNALSAIGTGGMVFRAWFFQRMSTTSGQRDWSGFDHTLAVARAHGVRVIATLANQWPDCEPASGYKDEAWYTTGYTQPDPSGTVSYRSWVAEVAARYRNNPTILAWQLVNEAEVKPYGGSGSCSANAAAILKAWAADVSGAIKAADPNHLVSLGTIGSGQCGASGAEYQDVQSVPTIDLCEYHDYGSPLTPIPGDQWNGLRVRLDQCAALNKPIFVGESGINPSDVGGYQGRADAFAAKFQAEFGAGVVGVLPWAWDSYGSTPNDYDIGPGDPLLGVMASATLPDHTCRGPKLVVAAGVNCNIGGWTFASVTVQPGGSLRLDHSDVTGMVKATGAPSVDLEDSSVGSLQISSTPAAGQIRLCDATIGLDGTLSGNAASATIGGPPGCAGDHFRTLKLSSNSGALSVASGTFLGSLVVSKNTGGVALQNNTIHLQLNCQQNAPAPSGSGNTAAAKKGQCAGL